MGVGKHHGGAGGQEDDELHVQLPLDGELSQNVKEGKYCGERPAGCPFYTFATTGSDAHPLEI